MFFSLQRTKFHFCFSEQNLLFLSSLFPFLPFPPQFLSLLATHDLVSSSRPSRFSLCSLAAPYLHSVCMEEVNVFLETSRANTTGWIRGEQPMSRASAPTFKYSKVLPSGKTTGSLQEALLMNPPTQEDKLTFKDVASFLKPYLQQVFSKWTPGPDTVLKPPAL